VVAEGPLGHLVPEELEDLLFWWAPRGAGAPSWTVRSFLGLAGLDKGGLRDLVKLRAEPLRNPAALAQPALSAGRPR